MKLKYILIFLISIFFVVGAFVFQQQLSHFRSLGLLGIFLINFIGNATVFLPAPAIASVVAGGVIYSPLAVAIASSFGSSMGEMIGFLLGVSGKELFIKNHHTWYKMLKDIFQKWGDAVIFFFAFVPNPIFDAVGILAGALRFSPVKFFLIMLAGRFIRGLLLAYLGSAFALH
ncbi:MAG: VTT domain-containing protein [Candidatus Levybacteria bacterium]|nr:VTT domain-containing protein [Candidatus Levybacteria bacterium]